MFFYYVFLLNVFFYVVFNLCMVFTFDRVADATVNGEIKLDQATSSHIISEEIGKLQPMCEILQHLWFLQCYTLVYFMQLLFIPMSHFCSLVLINALVEF